MHPCWDNANNFFESDTDCGGPQCPSCAVGKKCAFSSDCQVQLYCLSGTCTSGLAHCADSSKDKDETDVDCGGAECQPCAEGKACVNGNDCLSTHFCLTGTCQKYFPAPGPSQATLVFANGLGIVRDISFTQELGEPWLVAGGEMSWPRIYRFSGSTWSENSAQSLAAHAPGASPPGITQAEYVNFDGHWLITLGNLSGESSNSLFLWQYDGTIYSPKPFYSPVNATHLGDVYAATLAPDFGQANPAGIVTLESVLDTGVTFGRLRYRDMGTDTVSLIQDLGAYNTGSSGYQNGVRTLAFVPAVPGMLVTARYSQNLSTNQYVGGLAGELTALNVYSMDASTKAITRCGFLAPYSNIEALAVGHATGKVAIAYRNIQTTLNELALYDVTSFTSCSQSALNAIEQNKKVMRLSSSESIQDLAFAPGDAMIYAVMGQSSTPSSSRVAALRVDMGKRFVQLAEMAYTNGSYFPLSVAVSADNQFLAYGASNTGAVVIWKLK